MNQETQPTGLKHIYARMSSDSAEDLIFRNQSLLELAVLYAEKCDLPSAVECLEKAKTEALQFHLYENYFRAVNLVLRIHAERLEFDKLDSLVREVMQVGGSLSDIKRFLPKLNYNQGVAAYYRRDVSAAEGFFKSALRAAQDYLAENQDLSVKRQAEINSDLLKAEYGIVTTSYDDEPEHAIQRYEEFLEKLASFATDESPLDDSILQELEAGALIALGNRYRLIDNHQKSLDNFWKAHRSLKSHKNWSSYYYVLLGLGRVYQDMEDNKRAVIFFDLIADAIVDLELYALKEELHKASKRISNNGQRLVIDRERKVVIEKSKGEIHFERRFILLEILYLLVSEPGKIFTKDSLVELIWKESYNPMIHDSKVYTSISRLRKLIEPDFKRPRYILNERDGYSFNPSIQVEELGSNWSGGNVNTYSTQNHYQRNDMGVQLS